MKKTIFKVITLLFILFVKISFAQSIVVKADSYKQDFKGVGTSIGLYIYHHFSMNSPNQEKAMKWINKDLNMTFIQDYIQYYPSNTAYYDIRANYIKEAKVYQPNSQVAMVYDNFPDELRKDKTVSGNVIRILDVTRAGIYDELADWYFQSLKGFQERGVEVDILSVCNEPDFTRQHHFGFGNPKYGVGRILQEAVPKLKAMLANPAINTTNIKVPLIMAPSNLSTVSCLEYVKYYKNDYPSAWAQIDIVATHQYAGGYDETTIRNIKNELDGRRFYQSEMHADHSDNLNLGNLVERPHRASLDLSGLFNVAMNNGIESWFYFENNYPQIYHPGGLIRVPWGGAPTPYKHYYAFKQITSRQPSVTKVLDLNLTNIKTSEVSSFRKIDGDSIYLNVSNFSATTKQVPVEIKNNANINYKIKHIEVITTDATKNAEITQTINFPNPITAFNLSLPPFSIQTLTFALETNSSLSTDSFVTKPNFKIYSVNNSLKIVPLNEQKVKVVKVFSTIGKKIVELNNIQNIENEKITLTKGIYIVKIVDELDNSSVKKVIVK
ncbi:T9SS type A sorting domain-containing protein [Polaribacter aestuariivivens]|uniref:T9SS type A sorting domain-containing protein n=1 Tax=Polaribacter aestuariivivens TaxID=2304626 RepID=UPI003F49386B